MTDHPTPSTPEHPPLRVRAQCRAADRELGRLECHGVRLRIEADEQTGKVDVVMLDRDGVVTTRLSGRHVVELLCRVQALG